MSYYRNCACHPCGRAISKRARSGCSACSPRFRGCSGWGASRMRDVTTCQERGKPHKGIAYTDMVAERKTEERMPYGSKNIGVT